jgi:hypothetical protein
MSKLTAAGILLIPAGIVLLFVGNATLYGILCIAVGLGCMTTYLGIPDKPKDGARPGRARTAVTAWMTVAGLSTCVLTLCVGGLIVRHTNAYIWRYGTDVTLDRPGMGSPDDVRHGVGECTKFAGNWSCSLHWLAGDQLVEGHADIDQQEFADDSGGDIPARALGSSAVSVGARPRTIGSQVRLGVIPLWVALAPIVALVVAWLAARRRSGAGRARQPAVDGAA